MNSRHEIDIKDVPWQVSLLNGNQFFCGASIIGERWLLTAAHCLSFFLPKENIRVRVGSAENTNGGSIYKVKRTIQHEHFDKQSKSDYDFALIELEDGIKFDEKAQPIELVHENQEMIDGTMCLVTGWGRTQSVNESRRLLRGVEVPIANYQQCMYNYRRLRPVTPRMFCAGYEKGGKDACQGNSVFKTICITMN